MIASERRSRWSSGRRSRSFLSSTAPATAMSSAISAPPCGSIGGRGRSTTTPPAGDAPSSRPNAFIERRMWRTAPSTTLTSSRPLSS
jgi:hypothetical protein